MPSSTLQQSAALSEFQDKGFVIIRRLLAPGVISDVRHALTGWTDRLAKQLVDEGRNNSCFSNEPFETRLISVFRSCPERLPKVLREELHLPGMFSLFFNPRLLDIVETMLGQEIRLYPNYTVRPKLPEAKITEVPWHQDAAFTAAGHHGQDPSAGHLTAEKLRTVNVWAPLVPARRENGCMQFVPGSHRLGLVPHLQRDFDYLEIRPDVMESHLPTAVDVILDPGDVVLFSNLLFHVGLPNRSSSIRWSCDWRYQDATQSTMRAQKGHLARSQIHPEQVVRDGAHWASLRFS